MRIATPLWCKSAIHPEDNTNPPLFDEFIQFVSLRAQDGLRMHFRVFALSEFSTA
jgi:hypothetical protein